MRPSFRTRMLLGLAILLGGAAPVGAQARDVILATTTSTQDTGLLDSLLPRFEQQCSCRVKTIAVGTGQSLAIGARGDADVVLVHAPAVERRYVEQGHFINRRLVMSNDFVVVGPRNDPAGLGGARVLPEAMTRLSGGKAPFVSRGDSSGTNILELNLWRKAGLTPTGAWYLETGQGMGATLRVASEKQAYTLTDRGTYLALRQSLDLAIVFQGAPELLNIYHVMEVNPSMHPGVNHIGGRALADFFLSPAAQELIRGYGGGRFGQALFTPQGGKQETDLIPAN